MKKNFIKEEKIVYRWEKFIEKYEDGLIYEIYIFKFIIIWIERFKDGGLDLINE